MAGQGDANWSQNSIKNQTKDQDLRWKEVRGGKKKRMGLKSIYRTVMQVAKFTKHKRVVRVFLSGEMEYSQRNRPPDTYN